MPAPLQVSALSIRVPASTSNLGCGFDGLGLAFRLYNTFVIEAAEPGRCEFRAEGGESSEGIPRDGSNLFFRAARWLLENAAPSGGRRAAARRAEPPGFFVRATVRVPQTRGLGSSSTAVIAGMAAANAFARMGLTREALAGYAARFEGHPDNVAPSLLGGLVAGAMTSEGRLLWARWRTHPAVEFIALIPDYTTPTEIARQALPASVPHRDAVHNLTRTPLIVDRLHAGRLDDLAELMDDRLHEPYRRPLFRGFDEVKAAGRRAGAAAVVLSGAGPALIAICEKGRGGRIARAMERAQRAAGAPARALALAVDWKGALIRPLRLKK